MHTYRVVMRSTMASVVVMLNMNSLHSPGTLKTWIFCSNFSQYRDIIIIIRAAFEFNWIGPTKNWNSPFITKWGFNYCPISSIASEFVLVYKLFHAFIFSALCNNIRSICIILFTYGGDKGPKCSLVTYVFVSKCSMFSFCSLFNILF